MSPSPVSSTLIRPMILGTFILSSCAKLSAETTFPNASVSEEERQQYLDELQAGTTKVMIAAIVFLLILAVTGLIGNSLVIFVYSLKFKPSATRIIIITIAVFDLVANVLAIPGDVYDMFHIWDFDNPMFCRGRIFFSTFTTLSSAIALLAVAVVRYRKICTPHGWQVTIRSAKIVSVVVALLGILFSIPNTILYGRKTKPTLHPNISGYECTFDDSYVNTNKPFLGYGLFLVLYVCCSVALTVLYILVGIQAWKHRQRHSNALATKTKRELNPSCENNQSNKSQATGDTSNTGNTSNVIQIAEQSENRDTSSTSFTKEAGIDFSDIAKHLDLYTFRIFEDRIEIRSHIMGDSVANLRKSTARLESVPSNHDDTEDVLPTRVGALQDLEGQVARNFVAGVGADELCLRHSDSNTTRDVEGATTGDVEGATTRDVEGISVCLEDIKRCLDSNKDGTENYGSCSDGHSTDIKPKIDSYSSKEHTTKTTPCTIVFQKDKITGRTTYVLDFHTERDIERIRTNLMTASEQNENLECGTTSSCTRHTKDTASDKQPPASFTNDFSQASCDLDPIAALKSLDIMFLREGGDWPTADSDTPKMDKIPLNNSLLQKADWLRNIIAEVITDSTSRSARTGQVTGITNRENVELRILENRNTVSRDESPINDASGADGTKRQTMLKMKTTFKELISRKNVLSKFRLTSRGSKQRKVSRTTVMLVIISAIYILGFIPHLALMLYKFATKMDDKSLTPAESTVYNLFLRTYFLNCAANPIIYSLCDRNFRRECIGLFSCFSRG